LSDHFGSMYSLLSAHQNLF